MNRSLRRIKIYSPAARLDLKNYLNPDSHPHIRTSLPLPSTSGTTSPFLLAPHCFTHLIVLIIYLSMYPNNPFPAEQDKTKAQQLEEVREQKRKAADQLRLMEMQERALTGNSDIEVANISARVSRTSLNGPVSEPTTPPEYAQGAFSNSRYSRSSRLSANSIMSPPGLGHRLSQASSQIASPAGRLSGSMYQAQRASTKSMPGSRRGSDEEEDYAEDLPNIRPSGRYVILPAHSLDILHYPDKSSLFLAQNRSDLESHTSPTSDLTTHLSLQLLPTLLHLPSSYPT